MKLSNDMNLTSGSLYWPTLTQAPSYPPLQTSVHCDVAILGGGITGALIAYHLAEAGIDAVLLEKRTIGAGSTIASTALLQYEIDTHLIDLKDKVGPKQAVRVYEVCLEAIGKIEQLSKSLTQGCNFSSKQSLYLASHKKDIETLYQEFLARKQMGIKLEFVDATTLKREFQLERPAALLSEVAAQVDPYCLTHQLIRHAASQGLHVYENTEVTYFESDVERKKFLGNLRSTDPIKLSTAQGFSITAKRVIFATGYESQQYLSQKVANLNSSYAFVSSPLELSLHWLNDYLIWETARPYLYMRTIDKRILVGGEDVPFQNPQARDLLLKRKAMKLHQRFQKLFPALSLEIAFMWAGTFGETKDGLPFIGVTTEYPNAYFALGYGGNGITYSLIAAELICQALLGKAHSEANIFRFDR